MRQHGILVVLLALLSGMPASTLRAAEDQLAKGFQLPPDSARPWVWWFWLNNNVSRESITQDLEELRAKGIGGVTVYSIGSPAGPMPSGPDFLSPEWRRLFAYTVREADRLGLPMSLMLCSGWNAAGPWVTAEHACKRHIQSEITVTGPRHFVGKLPQRESKPRFDYERPLDELPQPELARKHYWDVNVQAFREPPGPAPRKSSRYRQLLAFKTMDDSPDAGIRQTCEEVRTALPAVAGETPLDPAAIVDLTAKLAPDGTLAWDVPPGRWTILRTGCTLTGEVNRQPTRGGAGLETDPLTAAALDRHVQCLLDPLRAEVGPRFQEVVRSVQIDSWEINLPNWSPTFLDDFRRYRGYDARPYLAAFSGRVVGSAEVTDRFLHDYRKTLADCVADRYYGRLSVLAHARHLLNQSEAGGICNPTVMCLDCLKGLGCCDVPMGEFWQDGCWTEHGQNKNGKQTAAAAHLYGKRIAAAEAFTRNRDPHWMESPALMKPVADKAFCDGFNWFFLASTATHASMGTPGDEIMGGVHFNREVTWWPQARPMIDYFARCSYLLQQGLFVADVCYYNGDEAPNFVGPKSVDPALGTGYDYDVCNAEVLLRRMAVRDGRIVLPDGMSYRLLVLPEREAMPVEVVSKLRDLVAAGATVVGPKPQRDTGLKDYPLCDREVQRLAGELWGDCDGKTVCQHRFGKGRIVWGVKLRDVLRADGVPPDFEYSAGKESYLDFLHRTVEGAEIYFVANRTAHEETARCTFRTSGKLPELWDPVGGAMRNAANYTIADGRTTLALMFPPHGSLFVVFRQPAPAARAEGRNFPVFRPVQELSGPWTVHFDPKWGGPETVRFGQLVSWTQRPEAGVKFYSGTATYHRRFDLPEPLRHAKQPIYLDLGSVRDVAEVRLNGRDLGVVWTAPWHVDITGAVRPADNVLEVRITNLWPNRLIGDAALPPGKRVAHTNVPFDKDHPLLPSGLLGPVRLMMAHDRQSATP